jgi:DNA-directed RNA polymerase specialized sigma24 family protein
MRDLDTLYHWYSTDPTKLDALLEDVTRFGRILARKRGHPSPDDAAQEITAGVWKSLSGFRPQSGSFKGWVYGIAARCIVNYFRSLQSQPVLISAHVEPDEPEWTSYDTSAMGPHMQKVVAMLEMGYTQDEIAAKFNCGRRGLRKIIEKHITNLSPVDVRRPAQSGTRGCGKICRNS